MSIYVFCFVFVFFVFFFLPYTRLNLLDLYVVVSFRYHGLHRLVTITYRFVFLMILDLHGK